MNQERLLKILLRPHVSEKVATGIEKNNSHVFEVLESATKSEISDAVESLFNTKVKSVRIVNVKPKTKVFRGMNGKRKAWKKAYITLQADQKIDLIGAQ